MNNYIQELILDINYCENFYVNIIENLVELRN